jgi:glycosyltransferase involved in cell wall biosynthesis
MICDVDLERPDATRTHTVEVARGFAAEGFHVDLVARGSDPCLTGVRHHRARGSETGRVHRIVDLSLRSLVVLCARRRYAERCYVRHKWSNVTIMLLARLLGYRVVTQVDNMPYGRGHEMPIPLVVDHVKRLTTILMCRLSHGIVVVTPQIKAQLVDELRTPAERIAVLPNGADIDFFHPLPRAEAIARAGLDPSCRYAAFCGHFQPWVDFDTLLEAFSKVAGRLTDARLILIGDGSERERIEREVRRLQIGDSVLITGFVRDRAAVRDLLAAATVTLSANKSKYLSPVKLAEYLACGRAVVATDLPGLKEAIEETGAGIVTSADPQAVSEAIVALLDPKRADELGSNGRRLAEELYAWRSIVHRTVPLFGI